MTVPASPSRALRASATHCARALGHSFVGTEHLLWAACADPAAAPALVGTDITAEAVRKELIAMIGEADGVAPAGIELTPRASAALDAADREAHLRGEDTAGALHVLGALADQSGTVAGVILAEAGVDRTCTESLLPAAPSRAWHDDAPAPRGTARSLLVGVCALAALVGVVRLLRW